MKQLFILVFFTLILAGCEKQSTKEPGELTNPIEIDKTTDLQKPVTIYAKSMPIRDAWNPKEGVLILRGANGDKLTIGTYNEARGKYARAILETYDVGDTLP